ncbi:MAG TPA: transglutaminase family protein [Bryobacteraceae bacterium]|nr:transglutaminase family protein [Bryobacteraceae bacterium]
MKVRATHTTTYLYTAPVSICHTAVHLRPRDGRNQRLLDHKLSIVPMPEATFGHKDYFGNDVTCFSIHEPHRTLTISAASLIEMEPGEPLEPCLTPAWEEARGEKWRHAEGHPLHAYQFVFPSPRITATPEFAAYAETSFTAGRPFLESAVDLCHRIYTEFHYDQRATTVATSVAEVLESKRGVCQDFAHFAIACLRSLGLAARYVSGYLNSRELIGSQASHAWVSVFFPGLGWLDLDPTNDRMVNGSYVTLAWGRDYSDVAPVNGVTIGGGQQVVNVSVTVAPAGG